MDAVERPALPASCQRLGWLYNNGCLGFSVSGMKRCTQSQRKPEGFQSSLLCSQAAAASVDPRCTECRNKLLSSKNASCLWSERGGWSFPSPTSLCKDPQAVLILNNALCLLKLHTCIIYLHYVLDRGMSCSCLYSTVGLVWGWEYDAEEGKQTNVFFQRCWGVCVVAHEGTCLPAPQRGSLMCETFQALDAQSDQFVVWFAIVMVTVTNKQLVQQMGLICPASPSTCVRL